MRSLAVFSAVLIIIVSVGAFMIWRSTAAAAVWPIAIIAIFVLAVTAGVSLKTVR